MSMKIKFDVSNNPEAPTFILATKNGQKLGKIDANEIVCSDSLKDASEFSFKVNKIIDGKRNELWDKIKDFRLVWCKEYDLWFQITVEIDESDETVKTVYGTRLGNAELSQIMLYDIEINTENDISRDDYETPCVLYNEENPKSSILHRIFEKAPHYLITHVDATIKNIQRTFSFNNISLYDACQEIGEEIGCLFIFNSNSLNGNIQRTVSVYDIMSNCNDCGYRGEFADKCPKCNSIDIDEGYGNDTTIFITSDELGEDIQFTTDTGSVKNCFKLEAGDDLMTATIKSCNPNGSDYIWHISDDIKEDMSDELANKLDEYENKYQYYQNNHEAEIDEEILIKYNSLIEKYNLYNPDLKKIECPIIGYPSLMTEYYKTIDFLLYLQSNLMPDSKMNDTSAEEQCLLLTEANLSPVAVEDVSNISLATANSVVLSMAKVIVDSRYQVKINQSSLNSQTWEGNFIVTNYSDEDDTGISSTVSILINDDYETFVEQKIEKTINQNAQDISIVGLFKMDYPDFVNELKKYCLDSLTFFHDSCQSCIDILIEQGISNKQTWSGSDPNLYDDLYIPYYNKLGAIESEMNVRQNEINIISGIYDLDGNLSEYGVQDYIISERDKIQDILDFQNFLGEDLWLEFCLYRREDRYINDNYISDGLDSAELFSKALEFIETASNEIFKSAELQHSISVKLKNLLAIKKFEKLVQYFEVGNWIRILVDEKVYKLRLLNYEIDFDNLENISVEFSDVMRTANGETDQRELIQKASSMATSYESTKRQAEQGAKSNSVIDNWFENGLNATNTKIIGGADNQTQTWDNHGMLFRRYNRNTDNYDDIQLKIINSTIAITDDNYIDPESGKLKNAYGVNAETVIGQLLLGENLAIRNESGSLTFDKDRLTITVRDNKWANGKAFTIRKQNDDGTYTSLFYVDDDGNLVIKGDGSGLDIGSNNSIKTITDSINANRADIDILYADKANVNDLTVINADIENLKVDKANVNDLETNYAKIGALEAVIADVNTINANKADINFANVNTATITEAWIKDLMVQGHIIAQSGTIYYLDAIHINANNIDTGTLTADRILLHGDDGLYYQINVDKLGESRIESMTELERAELKNTIHADVITAHSITSDQLTVNNIQGTGGWINLANGTFEYRNAINGNGISWDGEHLLIQADSIVFSSGNNAEEMVQEATDKAVLAKNIADSKNTVYYQTTAPTGGVYKINDVWFDTSSDNAIYCWNGTRWELHELGTAAIADGTITADKLTALDVIAQRLMAQDIEVTGVTHSTDYVRTGVYADSGMGIEFNTRRFATPNFAIDPSGNIYARGGKIAGFKLKQGSNVVYNLGEPDKFLSTDGESGRYQYDAPYLTAGEDGTAIYNIPKTATSAGETYTIGKLWVQVFEGSPESESEDVDQRLAGRVIYLRHNGTWVHESDFSALVYHPDGSLLGNTFALNAEYLAQSVSVRLEVDLATGDTIKVQRQYGAWQALYAGSADTLMGDPNGIYLGTDGISVGEDIALTPDGHATVGTLTVQNNIGVNGDVNSSGTVRGKNCIVENEANDGRIMIRDAGGVARYALWMSASNRICVGNDNSFISTTIRGGGGITLNNDTTVNGHVTATGSLVAGQNVVIHNDGSVYIRDVNNVARRMLTITSANAATVGHGALPLSVYGSGITLAGATTISGNLSNTGTISAGSSVNATTGVAAGNNYGFYVKNASGSLIKLFWLTSGNVCTVGSDSYATSILGKTITASKTITVSSDRRLKRDITVLDGRHQALFDRLCPVSYRLQEDEDGKEHIGLVAQEVQEALEQSGLTNSALVQADSEGMLSIGYGELIGLLVDEVQTLKAQMQQQETTIEALTRRLDALERGN